jgi:hypothetical protein
MRLVDVVQQETGVAFDHLMLLRHSTQDIDALLAHGGTVEEYTNTQPTGSKYDFLATGRPLIEIVVVIVHDRVDGVYRVSGVETEGMSFSLASKGKRQFDLERKRIDHPARRFRMTRVHCLADEATIRGWKGREIVTTLRNHTQMFNDIEVDLVEGVRLPEEVPAGSVHTEGSVQQILVNRYERDPRARTACIAHYGSTCVICRFNFGIVYGSLAETIIHVHHLKPLAEIGREYRVDPVADLRPVCPNCHAVIHQGGGCRDIQEVKKMLEQGGSA